MRFSRPALLALIPLATAKDLYDYITEFYGLTSTDTAAFTLWRHGYGSAYKTFIVSYYNTFGPEAGYASAEIASIESSLVGGVSAAEATQDYNYYLSAFDALASIGENLTDDYLTGSDYLTASDDYYYGDYSTLAGFATQSESMTTAFATRTALAGSHATSSASAVKTGSSITTGPELSSDVDSSLKPAKASNSAASRLHSSSSESSSAPGSSSSAMGGHQAPMIIGAALAGISVLLL